MILRRTLLLLVFITITTTYAQKMIKGAFTPLGEYSWVILYELRGDRQIYVSNTSVKEGKFSIRIPLGVSKGMMRLVYSMDKGKSIDFIYEKKNIFMSFNPNEPETTLTFKNSKENSLYREYLNKITKLQTVADSIQAAYLSEGNQHLSLAQDYKKMVKKIYIIQREFENESKGMIANHFVKASAKFYSQTIIKNTQSYQNAKRQHFFDYIDFSDKYLKKSSFISEKILQYVLHSNTSNSVGAQNKLYEKASMDVLKKVENKVFEKANILELLLLHFSNTKNISIVDFLMNEYKKLPENIQSNIFRNKVETNLRLAKGKKAPDFYWGKDNKKGLHKLSLNVKNYVVVFWSSSCEHCLKEIPKLYDFSKNKRNLKVIAVALENDDSGFKYYTARFKKWINILILKKWESDIVKLYDVHSTPTYYILDKNKKIEENPKSFRNLKAFFDKNDTP